MGTVHAFCLSVKRPAVYSFCCCFLFLAFFFGCLSVLFFFFLLVRFGSDMQHKQRKTLIQQLKWWTHLIWYCHFCGWKVNFICYFDLFSGMLEPSDPKGGELSATFQCVLANQFQRTKLGDRFWHENAPNATLNTDKTAFNRCQLKEIRKTRFSRIICDNSDDITAIQKDALMQSSVRSSCDELPTINLKAWITECPSG